MPVIETLVRWGRGNSNPKPDSCYLHSEHKARLGSMGLGLKKPNTKIKMETVAVFASALFQESRVTNLPLAISSGNGIV